MGEQHSRQRHYFSGKRALVSKILRACPKLGDFSTV
jgi:hypothetical protein